MGEIVYVTKHALTAGIQKYEVDGANVRLKHWDDTSQSYLYISGSFNGVGPAHYTDSLAVAKERANKMIEKKRASLQKQLDKLNALEIKVVDGK